MYCARIFVLIFSTTFAAVAIVSIFFPIFRKTSGGSGLWSEVRREKVWNELAYKNETFGTLINGNQYSTLTSGCAAYKNYFIALLSVTVGGAVFGFLSAIEAGAQTAYRRHNCCTCAGLLFFLFISFACEAVAVAMSVYLYYKYSCDFTNFKIFKDNDYKFVEGFALTCVACGGFLVAFLFQFFA